jgi:type II secretory pathway component PulJ
MSIDFLIAIAIFAAILLLAYPLLRAGSWIVEVVEARNRRRHAVRRRARAKGYIPVYDDRWEPRV